MPRITIYTNKSQATALAMLLMEGEYEFRVELDPVINQLMNPPALRSPNPSPTAPRITMRSRHTMEILMDLAQSTVSFDAKELGEELVKGNLKASSAGPTLSKAARSTLIVRNRDGRWRITDAGMAFANELASKKQGA